VLKLQTTDLATIAMYLARLPKENGKRGRMIVFTHGAKPTIVIQGEQLVILLRAFGLKKSVYNL